MKPTSARIERDPGEIVAAALALHARGFAVIPLTFREKNPNRQGWERERYTAQTIPAAFKHAGGIGAINGRPSNGAVNIDPDGPEAAAAWDRYRLETHLRHGRTSGYVHDFYFVDGAPPTEHFKDPVDGSPLFDFLSDGSQVVVPPSHHRDTGELIVWLEDGEAAHVDVADLLRRVRHAAAAALLARRYVGEGSRHEYRLALAGGLLRGGLAANDAERLMTVSAGIAGADPHDAVQAVRDTAAKIARGERTTGIPRLVDVLGVHGKVIVERLTAWLELRASDDDSPPLDLWGSHLAGTPALDLATVPPVLADVAADVGVRHGCDPALFALPALAVCAGAIDDRHRLQPRQNDTRWLVSARIWAGAVADSSEGKSPAIGEALGPLLAVDVQLAAEDEPARRQYVLALKTYNRAVEQWIRGGSLGTPPTEPERPPDRCHVVTDFTTEALSDVLLDNPGGVLIGVDELSGLFGGLDAYRPAGSRKDQPLLLELYEGGEKIIRRVKRGKVAVPNWGASIVGGIQPEPLRKIADRITGDGILARFLPFFASTAAEPPDDRAENHRALARYRATIARLVALPPIPTRYILAREAHRRREYIAATARAVKVLPTTSPGFRSHLGKWEGLFARLALTCHLVDAASRDETPPPVIPDETAERVARLMVNYVLPHAARLYGELLGQDHLTDARSIAGHILARRLDKISARDIGQAQHAFRNDRTGLRSAMETLSIAGWTTPIDGAPGRPPTQWRVNPRVHQTFAKRAQAEQARRDVIKQRIRAAQELLGLGAEDE